MWEYGCAERLEKFFDAQLKAQGLVDEEAFKPRSKKIVSTSNNNLSTKVPKVNKR